jgi:hypothetical protein
MPKIAISYRRADTQPIVGRIFDRLVSRYGKDEVYIDIDNIPVGMDFRSDIDQTLREIKVLLVVVGQQWRGPRDRDPPRIFDEDDPVRQEVQTALACKTRIVPVLIDNAGVPAAADLPDSLKAFSFLNALPVDSGRDFNDHIARVIKALDEILEFVPVDPPATSAAERRPAANPAMIALKYLFVPAVVMTLVYYAIVFDLSANLRFAQIGCLLIAAVAGFLLSRLEQRDLGWAVALGVATAVVAVGLMLAAASLLQNGSFLPSTTGEWREVVETAVSIVAGMFAGSLIDRVMVSRRAAPAKTTAK